MSAVFPGVRGWPRRVRQAITYIAQELRVVVLDNGCADEIGTRGEVHHSGDNGTGVATGSASAALGDGELDGGRVIGHAVAYGTKVLDISPDLPGLARYLVGRRGRRD